MSRITTPAASADLYQASSIPPGLCVDSGPKAIRSVPAVRAASRVIVENFPPVARVADVSDGPDIEDLCDIPDADIDRMKAIRDAARAKIAQTHLEE